jgi:hypothetical protein
MFKTKTKIILLDRDWNEVFRYNSNMKPIEGEFIYIEGLKSYYKVFKVVHSIMDTNKIILVVEKVEGL